MHPPRADDYRDRLVAAYKASQLTVDGLWLRYLALGGNVGRMEIEAYLNGLMAVPTLQHDVLAHAINERLDEIAPARAPYLLMRPPTLDVDRHPADTEREVNPFAAPHRRSEPDSGN
ncbi:hypothetical protein [Nocardia iowensis]|uniref:Uncharacterized protein n=1 Tax=Nocardia iowensis TaxID=204891 RepID=A0ABX8RWZ4_NOCIO|nr:hypothetical protein [Nocardia iowensis]QXN94179.1 hypothetical protein KV110_14600 [Nocardia iowensis]